MSSTIHQTTPLAWRAAGTRPQRLRADIARPQAGKKTRIHPLKAKERRVPVISYREVIAAWMLIVLVGAALFGSDFLWRDAATSCAQRVVTPDSHVPDSYIPGTTTAYDHGERLDRLDWDKDINAGGTPAAPQAPHPCAR